MPREGGFLHRVSGLFRKATRWLNSGDRETYDQNSNGNSHRDSSDSQFPSDSDQSSTETNDSQSGSFASVDRSDRQYFAKLSIDKIREEVWEYYYQQRRRIHWYEKEISKIQTRLDRALESEEHYRNKADLCDETKKFKKKFWKNRQHIEAQKQEFYGKLLNIKRNKVVGLKENLTEAACLFNYLEYQANSIQFCTDLIDSEVKASQKRESEFSWDKQNLNSLKNEFNNLKKENDTIMESFHNELACLIDAIKTDYPSNLDSNFLTTDGCYIDSVD